MCLPFKEQKEKSTESYFKRRNSILNVSMRFCLGTLNLTFKVNIDILLMALRSSAFECLKIRPRMFKQRSSVYIIEVVCKCAYTCPSHLTC